MFFSLDFFICTLHTQEPFRNNKQTFCIVYFSFQFLVYRFYSTENRVFKGRPKASIELFNFAMKLQLVFLVAFIVLQVNIFISIFFFKKKLLTTKTWKSKVFHWIYFEKKQSEFFFQQIFAKITYINARKSLGVQDISNINRTIKDL